MARRAERPVIVISPHLDDAVFSLAGSLNGATVVTICAGVPDCPPSDFDKRAGFQSGREAMLARREEDLAAADILGFTAKHLDCLDSAYGSGDVSEAVGQALQEVKGGEPVFGPLGLRHPDHIAVAVAFRAHTVGLNAWVYEELPYAYVWPEDLAPALQGVPGATLTLPSPEGKREAVEAYRSQIGPHTHMEAILAPERVHPL